MHRVAGLRDRALSQAKRATGTMDGMAGTRRDEQAVSPRGFPPCLLSWRAPGVVPLLGGQRVRVAAAHLFALAPPRDRDYTRGGVRLFAPPAAAGRGLTSELVAVAMGWVKLHFCRAF
jgi:hypothetical protein